MLFNYIAVNTVGAENRGTIDAVSQDTAITALQRRGLIIISVLASKDKDFFAKDVALFGRVNTRDIVILSRQIATMFEAQVSALQTFSMLAIETDNRLLGEKLQEIVADIQNGMAISGALAKHPKVFSNFYVNMVRSGEESGSLSEVFVYLADYLERNHELTSKARGALIYPAFVMIVFVTVMILLFVLVIPQLSEIIKASGQDIPWSTAIVMGLSSFLLHYGFFVALTFVALGCFVYYLKRAEALDLSSMKLDIPIIGNLYRKLYLSRITDNMATMLSSGVSLVKTVEITAGVVDNKRYAKILFGATQMIKSGSTVADAFEGYEEIPRILILMIKVGEESGALAQTLQVMAKFYRREVENTIHSVISLIEPAMIVALGLSVGIVMASVLLPIYDIAGNF
ncbi:type II secretion system F family protein [Patescibacteria group bacterium]|nr:type II secretion system F family protein [Patescibacteria group bacterium]MBU1246403.1 type II secretion system F family protein [Patescibacteria group bacterium]MBU1519085.1 type II secretion system F family protein [Patescibacteria group bacterium]MBU1956379.1 type II secretion system F family protein [Patescibacteria group bacterium]MBU2416895.1 type II secretion system F family protein [Patescibacteria group bacterium]